MGRLLKWWRKNRHGRLDRPAVYRQVYPGKKYLERDWYLLLSRFQALVEQFLVIQELQTDDLQTYPLLLRNYRRRQQEEFFQRTMNQARSLQEKRGEFQARRLYWDYDLEQEYYDYIASPNRQEYTNLQEVSDKLDHFYIAEKLKQACLAHSRGVANQETYDIRLLDGVLQEIQDRPVLLQVPAILMYATCYRAVVLEGDENSFAALRRVMDTCQEGFPAKEMRDIYLLAINYCIRAINQSQQAFIAAALALYEQSLDRGYLLEDGYIPESTFSNMVSLALKLGRYEWVRQFIDDHQSVLREEYRASLVSLNLAKSYYAEGDLSAAMQQLVLVEAKAPFLYLGAKSLQLKVFYELAEWDALDSLLESFRVYLQRRPDLGYRREHYQHLIQFTRRLLQLKPGDQAARQQLTADIQAAEVFQEKEWFLAKI